MEASRIANVSAAVLVGFGEQTPDATPDATRDAIGLAARMAQIFEDTLWVGDAPPEALPARHVYCREDRRDFVTGVAAAIAAAHGDRVIVVGEGDGMVSAELLLSLVAWPEAAIVMPSDSAGVNPLSVIYRRADLLSRAREALASPGSFPAYESFVAGLETVLVPLARLGLAGSPSPLFADPDVGSRALR